MPKQPSIAVIHPIELVQRGFESTVKQEGYSIVPARRADVVIANVNTGADKIVVVVDELADVDLKDLIGQGVNAVIDIGASRDEVGAAVMAAVTSGFYTPPTHRTTLEALIRADHHRSTGLTPREYRVVELLTEHPDWTNAELAAQLGLTVETIKSHLQGARKRLSAGDRKELVHRARELGVFEDEVVNHRSSDAS